MNPCDLRLSQGDQAIVDLASRASLFEFAIRSVLSQMDLRHRGRDAEPARCHVVAHIKDLALRAEYTRQLAG